MTRIAPLLLIVALAAAPLYGATAPTDAGQRRRFIAGAPDRLASAGDRRLPRRWCRADSAVGAYADVDRLDDSSWLAHEVEGYAYRLACGAAECRRAVVPLGAGSALHLAAAGRAELVWTSGRYAVRLGWRRVVTTATGTMTVEQPPVDFLAELAGEWPSDLAAVSLDPDRRRVWAETEIDRQLYYLAAALRTDVVPGAARRFARAALQALGAHEPGIGLAADGSDDLDAIRAWVDEQRGVRRPVCEATPWCVAASHP